MSAPDVLGCHAENDVGDGRDHEDDEGAISETVEQDPTMRGRSVRAEGCGASVALSRGKKVPSVELMLQTQSAMIDISRRRAS